MLNGVLYVEQIFRRQKTTHTPFRWHTFEGFVVVCTSGNKDDAGEEEKERVQ